MTGRRRLREILAGGLMTVSGLAVALEARSYGMGTTERMGPGFYPVILGVALALVGVLIAVARDREEEQEDGIYGRPDWRGWLCIIAGIGLFIVVGEHLGLGPATFACVFVSALGDSKSTLKASLALAAGATLMAALVFSWLLKFQLPFLIW